MNILKLLSANETATVTAGQIFWAYDNNRDKCYFVPGPKARTDMYKTRLAAQHHASVNHYDNNTFIWCNTIDDAQKSALNHGGQHQLTNFFKITKKGHK